METTTLMQVTGGSDVMEFRPRGQGQRASRLDRSRPTRRRRAEDLELARRVTEALAATAHVHTSSPDTSILVRARAGVVTLVGHVGLAYERPAAVRVAESMFGVRSVRSRVSVQRAMA